MGQLPVKQQALVHEASPAGDALRKHILTLLGFDAARLAFTEAEVRHAVHRVGAASRADTPLRG